MKTVGSFGSRACAAVACVLIGYGSAFAGGIPASAYVQDGLVAQYDAIENAGAGVHDGAATMWKDLKGGGGDLALSAVVNPIWSERALSFDSCGAYNATDTNTFLNTPNTLDLGASFTFQVFCNTGSDSNCRRWDMVPYTSNYETWSSSSEGFLERINGANRFTLKPWLSNADILFSTIVGDKKHQFRMDRDGQVVNAATGSLSSCAWNNKIAFFKATAKGRKCYAMRIYNRPLTADEIAKNAQIDMLRFTYGDGCRINAQTGKVEFRVAAASTAERPVSLDDETYATAVTNWYEEGGSVTVKCRVPENYRIVRWDGVPCDAVPGADQVSFAATVCEISPAIGYVPFGSDAYISKGLYEQWDGIDNAGRGQHDGTATTWKGLVSGNTMSLARGSFDENSFLSLGYAQGWRGKTSTITTFNKFNSIDLYVDEMTAVASAGIAGLNGRSIWRKTADNVSSVGFSKSVSFANDFTNPLGEKWFYAVYEAGSDVLVVAYDDGVLLKNEARVEYANAPNQFSIGGASSYDEHLHGHYYAVRLYNRTLDEAEQLVNRNIDKVRFKLADPADLTWPEGMRMNGSVLETSVAVDYDEEKGTVTLNGEAVEPNVPVYVRYGSVVTLTATPKTGCRLRTWDGFYFSETGTFERQDVTQAFVVKTADKVLTATFVEEGVGFWDVPGDFATLAEAMASDQIMAGDTIRLAEGVHTNASDRTATTVDSIALKVFANVDKPVVIEGMGTDKTVLDLGGDGTLLIDNPEAILRNLVITNFQNKTATASTPLFLNQGTATNVVITGAQPSSGYKDNNYIAVVEKGAKMCGCDVCDITNTAWVNSAIIWVKGGTLCHSKVRRCSNYNPKVKMSVKDSVKPLIEDCELTDNLNSPVLYGGFIARNTLIARNRSSQVVNADGSYVLDGCRILDNVITSGSGAIVYFGGYSYAYMTNCLVAGNQTYSGPVLYSREYHRVHICNCTVVNNSTFSGGDSTFKILTGSTGDPSRIFFTNTIFHNNLMPTFNLPAEDGKFYKTVSHCLYPEAEADDPDGNVSGDPRLIFLSAGDYTLNADSPCIDAGVDLPGVPVDIDGRERPLDGNRDGVAVTDIGCYEKPETLDKVRLAFALDEGAQSVTVNGEPLPDDGVVMVEIGSSVELRATAADGSEFWRWEGAHFDGLPAMERIREELTVVVNSPDEIRVRFRAAGARVHNVPGEFDTLGEALASDSVTPGDTIRLGEGVREQGLDRAAMTIDGHALKVFAHIDRPIVVEGTGAGTLLDCGGDGSILLDHPEAVIRNLVITNFQNKTAVSSPALCVNRGLATNITVNGAQPDAGYKDVSKYCVVIEKDGVMCDCDVRDITNTAWVNTGIVYLKGGTLCHSKIRRCSNNGNKITTFFVSDFSKTLVDHCELTENSNSRIISNGDDKVYYVRDTLIASNRCSQVIWADRGFFFTRCRILDNVITSGDGSIVYFGG